jgi:hypothetical protein
MRYVAVLSAILTTSTFGYAQSRVDRVPEPALDPTIPLAPSPSDEIRDQPPTARAKPEIVDQAPEPASKLVVAGQADDTISRHFIISIGAGYAPAFGHLDSQTSLSNRVSGGGGYFLDVGYGVTRYVELELHSAFSIYGSATECPSCDGKSFDEVASLRYHLVQGVKFDPWLRTGLGVSTFQLHELQHSQTYVGLRWFELSIGGDWYFTRNLGVGPLIGLSLSSYLDHPAGAKASVSGTGFFGINVSFDSSGK